METFQIHFEQEKMGVGSFFDILEDRTETLLALMVMGIVIYGR